MSNNIPPPENCCISLFNSLYFLYIVLPHVVLEAVQVGEINPVLDYHPCPNHIEILVFQLQAGGRHHCLLHMDGPENDSFAVSRNFILQSDFVCFLKGFLASCATYFF